MRAGGRSGPSTSGNRHRAVALAVGVAGALLSMAFAFALVSAPAPETSRLPLRASGIHEAACGGPLSLQVSGGPLNGTAPLNTSFTAGVAGGCPPYEVEWELGDGYEHSGLAVSHTFRSAGTFHVYVTAQDSNGSRVSTGLAVHVSGGAGPMRVSVQLLPSSGGAPLAVEAWANATGSNLTDPITTSWRFGDGGAGTASPIKHVFSAPGTYGVRATVTDALGRTGTGFANLTVRPNGTAIGPMLSLSADPLTGTAPLDVEFSASAPNATAGSSLSLCFGDSTGCSMVATGWSGAPPADAEHRYALPGTYPVEATLSNGSGGAVASATLLVRVSVGGPLAIDASEGPGEGSAPWTVAFHANISGGAAPYAVQWSFGDGAAGSSVPGEAVSHTYGDAGVYHPQIMVTDASGHRANATLAPVTVRAPISLAGLPTRIAGLPTWGLIGATVGLAIVAVAVLLRRGAGRRRGRFRQEGEALVREMEHQK